MKYYFLALKNYFETDGRANRKEYWYFLLFSIIISTFLTILDILLKLTYQIPGQDIQILSAIYTILVLCPSVTIQIRRLHDIGKSWKWFLLNFIPVIGWIILFFFHIRPSQIGQNKYGPGPSEPVIKWDRTTKLVIAGTVLFFVLSIIIPLILTIFGGLPTPN